MKPLPRAPFTDEDRAIFSAKLQTGPWPFCAYLEFMGRNADRRDAELMFEFMRARVRWFGRWLIRARERRAILAYQSLDEAPL